MRTPSIPIPSSLSRLGVLAATSFLAACAVGPNYHRPVAASPAVFKEAQGWTPSQPADHIDRGAWWAIFNDPVLDDLEKRVAINNQNIAAAEAAYRSASATVREAQAALFPTVSGSASETRSERGAGASSVGAAGLGIATSGAARGPITSYNAALSASWSLDIWGRVRRTVESNKASAQMSAATLAAARLSYQGALATAYFSLRAVDENKTLYDGIVESYRRSLQLTRNQYKEGIISRADVATAETQYNNALASAADLGVQRAQFEHAIATLVGLAPADFTLPPGVLAQTVPTPPLAMPSTLLERRPDIAEAERAVAAANAQIGVKTAAYFPNLTLSGSYGASSSALSSLFNVASRTWSVGPALADTIIDFGARRAQVDEARAAYDQRVALYRQTVLAAFQDVEDNLAALRVLQDEARLRDATVTAAQTAEQLAINRYKAGQIDYSVVVQAQNAAASAQQSRLTTLRSRLLASVNLIQGLGGGWSTADLPR